jgi:integrase
MDIAHLLKSNRKSRKQTGQRFETDRAFFLRYYHTEQDGKRKQKAVLLAYKTDMYRSWVDVEPLIRRELERVNTDGQPTSSGRTTLAEFIEGSYLPWCKANKAASTANGYERVWEKDWKDHIGGIALTDLQTAQATAVLTKHAKDGKGSRTLSHIKWMLSGVYVYAVAEGIVPKNPVPEAKWNVKVARSKSQTEYSLDTVMRMLQILEPIDIRAAAAVGLAFFAALRPSEIRGLQWDDYDGSELHIKRTVWRNTIGETKTEGSAASVPVIDTLKGLLEKLRAQSAGGFMIQNHRGRPLDLNSLNWRLIAPAMEKAGIEWRGFYPARRGISSLVTDSSKNALNSTGLLRHSTPITALKHYTRAQKDSILAAMETIEGQAVEITEKNKAEVIQ